MKMNKTATFRYFQIMNLVLTFYDLVTYTLCKEPLKGSFEVKDAF